MITGLVLGEVSWKTTVEYSRFWTPEKYGVKMVVQDAKGPDIKTVEKYDFVIATDVWGKSFRDKLNYVRKKGVKVFYIPKEVLAFDNFEELLFKDTKTLYKGSYYFVPDVVLSPGEMYTKMWEDKASVYLTGHPKFDYCLYEDKPNRDEILSGLGLNPDKKILFFPSYTVFNSIDVPTMSEDWEKLFGHVHAEREKLLEALLFVANNRNDTQVVVKLHPMSIAALRKRGKTKDIEGISFDYLENPSDKFIVLGGRIKDLAKNLIQTCDAIVSSNSTMMIEAALLNKPVLRALMGVSNNLVTHPGYDDIFKKAVGFDEVVSSINKMLDGGDFSTNGGFEKHLLVDGKSCERICSAIKKETLGKK